MESPSFFHLCTEVNRSGVSLFESGKWCDCFFRVGTELHQEVISGHKLILAMASSVFEAMLYGTLAEIEYPINIVDIQPDIFKSMIQYIYTGQLCLSSVDEACSMCYTAEKYELKDLLTECLTYLYTVLNPRNACQIYEIAQLIDKEDLMKNCLQLISENTGEAFNDSSFEDLMPNTLITILSLDDLDIGSEVDLIDAVVRYANAERRLGLLEEDYLQLNVNKPSEETDTRRINIKSVEENAEDNVIALKTDIRRMIEKIRFLTLTPQQFAESQASLLLTEAESLAVLLNLTLSESSLNSVPMPSGFSTSRMSRTEARTEGTFRFTIEEVNMSDPVVCPPRFVRHLPWQMTAMRSQIENQPNTLGLFLTCNFNDVPLKQSCFAVVEFRLVSNNPDSESFCRKIEHVFTENEHQCGFNDFIPWDDVLDSTQGYINKGTFTLEVYICPDQPCYME